MVRKQRDGSEIKSGADGGSIPSLDQPAFRLASDYPASFPVLIAVPHAGRAYPPSLIERMREPGKSCLKLEDRYVDLVGKEVAAATGAGLLVARAPRAMIDLNRAQDDMDWGMVSGTPETKERGALANRRARSGLGLVPRRLPGLGEIWKDKLSGEELASRIAGIYRPYHQTLGQSLERIRDIWGAALLIDLHSMPPLKSDRGRAMPADFVIGDRFGASSSAALSARALDYLDKAGRRVAHNRPYSGGYVLDTHAAPRRGIHGLQVEICRSAYLDGRLDQPGPRLPSIARLLSGLVRTLADDVARLGDGDAMALAAE